MANKDATRFYVKDTEIITVVEKLLANIKDGVYNINGSSSIDYTAILNSIEQALNSPNPSIPITDINTGDYTTAPIQTKQYQNTQYLKAILTCIGQATNISPAGLSIMGFIERIFQQYFLATIRNVGEFVVPDALPINIVLPLSLARKLIIHNKGTSNVFIANPDIQPVTTNDGLMIMPNEKLELEWVVFNNGIDAISQAGSNTITVHVITP